MGERHLENVLLQKLEIVGIVDQFEESLRRCAERFSLAEEACFTDPVACLEMAKPECVIVSTTAPSHCELVCLAAKMGARYILCEKPMAISLEQCDHMIEVAARHGARLAVNHQMRFMEQYTKPKAWLASEEFGGFKSATFVGGNFGLAMNASHYIEMFRYLSDELPIKVSAWFSDEDVPNPRGVNFHDKAGSLRIETANGHRLYMEIGADQGHGMRMSYAGRLGQIFVDEGSGKASLSYRKGEDRELPTTRYLMPSIEREEAIEPASATAPSLRVLQALLDGNDYPDGAIGRMAVAALVAAHVSDESGHVEVSIDEKLPAEREFPWA